MTRGFARPAAIVVILLFVVFTAPPASAHGGDESTEGYLLVQQALGHLAHDASANGIDLAMEKVGDALETDDQEGVSVPEVEQARTALEAGNATEARALLQNSIEEAVSGLPRATGNETGTTTVVPELPGRSGLGGQDWLFLLLSIGAVLVGSWLAFLFKPHESIGVLRSLLRQEPEAVTLPVPDHEKGL